MSSPSASSFFECRFTAQSAPIGSAPSSKTGSRPSFAISRTYIVPCFPKVRSITDVKPVATVRHFRWYGFSGSHVTPSLPGLMRQIREVPGANGAPFSSETYQAPSGPTATAVGTDSANALPPSGDGTSSRRNRATVVMFPCRSMSRRSLFAASVTRTLPCFSTASPFGFDSSGLAGTSWSSGSGSVCW